jgi:hypothetical protein
MQIGLRATSGCAGVSGDHARRHGARHGRFCHLSIEISDGCGWIVVKYRPAQLVLRSASTCLLIAMPLLWYISDETKVQFGRGVVPAESTMPPKRSKLSKANRDDVDQTPSAARRPTAISIDPVAEIRS